MSDDGLMALKRHFDFFFFFFSLARCKPHHNSYQTRCKLHYTFRKSLVAQAAWTHGLVA
jgi:hypothetical protein